MRGALATVLGHKGRSGVRAAGRRTSFLPQFVHTLLKTQARIRTIIAARAARGRVVSIAASRARHRGWRPSLCFSRRRKRRRLRASKRIRPGSSAVDSLLCAPTAHSSSGLGHRPLTAAARVRIPYAPLSESPANAGLFLLCGIARCTVQIGARGTILAHVRDVRYGSARSRVCQSGAEPGALAPPASLFESALPSRATGTSGPP